MRVSKEFGELLDSIKGEDTFGKFSLKTSISKSYVTEMVAGRVPTPEAIERIIEGYKDVLDPNKIKKLYAIAGYALPSKYAESEESDPVKRVEYALSGALIDDYQKQMIEELIKKHHKK